MGSCKVIGLLPDCILYHTLGPLIYFVLYKVVRYRRSVVRTNLSNSFPEKTTDELRHIERRFYRHLAEVFVDTIKLATISRKEILDRMVYRDVDKMEEAMQGKSYRKMLTGEDTTALRDAVYYHYYEYPLWHHVQPHYGVRTDRYVMAHFYYDIDVWEMYDLEKDPNELHNIYGNPEYAAVRDSLMQDLETRQVQYGDTGSLDEFRAMTDLKESDNK